MAFASALSISRAATFALVTGALTWGLACDGEKKSDAANSPKAADAAGGSDAAPIVGKPVEGEGGVAAVKAGDAEAPPYEFRVQQSGDYKKDQEGVVMLALVPAAGWHLNLEFPTVVKLEASAGVKLAKSELRQADASSFGEKGFEFGVHLTPVADGEQKVSGKIKFAVCQEEACSPQSEEIAFALAVN